MESAASSAPLDADVLDGADFDASWNRGANSTSFDALDALLQASEAPTQAPGAGPWSTERDIPDPPLPVAEAPEQPQAPNGHLHEGYGMQGPAATPRMPMNAQELHHAMMQHADSRRLQHFQQHLAAQGYSANGQQAPGYTMHAQSDQSGQLVGYGPHAGHAYPGVRAPVYAPRSYHSFFEDGQEPGALYFTLKSAKQFSVQVIGGPSHLKRVAKSVLMQAMGKKGQPRDLGDGGVEYVFSITKYQPLLQAVQATGNPYSAIPKDVVDAVSMGTSRTGGKEDGDEDVETARSALGELAPRIPDSLLESLAPFQVTGVRYCLEPPREGVALIADDMGLGKTIQAIACAAAFSDEWPLLIICPTSAKWHWQDEVLRWLGDEAETVRQEKRVPPPPSTNFLFEPTPSPTACPSPATPATPPPRQDFHPRLRPSEVLVAEGRQCKIPRETRVLILSYTLLHSVAQRDLGMDFAVIIADECHYLKNSQSRRSKAAEPLLSKARHRLLLSGTPALSRPMEMFSQLRLLRPDLWMDRRAFGKRYCTSRRSRNGGGDEGGFKGSGNLTELHAMLRATVMLRRRKKEVLKFLPPKRRRIRRVLPRCPEMRVLLAQYMEQLRESKQALGRLARSQKRRRIAEGFGESLGHVEGCTCAWGQKDAPPSPTPPAPDPSDPLADPTQDTRGNRNRLMGFFSATARAKLEAAVQRVEEVVDDPLGGKVLVFAHHKFVLDYLAIAMRRKIGAAGYMVLDGRTNSITRHANIEKFQKKPQCRVGLLSITAAGVGITLTAATTVLFAELFWTPGSLLQAEDRAHRIGQTSVVQIEYLVCEGSLDDVLWPLVEKKCKTLGEMIEGDGADNDLAAHHGDGGHASPRRKDDGSRSPSPSQSSSQAPLEDFGGVLKALGREAIAEALSRNGKAEGEGDMEDDAAELEQRIEAIEAEEAAASESDVASSIDEDDDEDGGVELLGSQQGTVPQYMAAGYNHHRHLVAAPPYAYAHAQVHTPAQAPAYTRAPSTPAIVNLVDDD